MSVCTLERHERGHARHGGATMGGKRVTWAGVRLIVALWGTLLLGIGIVVAIVVAVGWWVLN